MGKKDLRTQLEGLFSDIVLEPEAEEGEDSLRPETIVAALLEGDAVPTLIPAQPRLEEVPPARDEAALAWDRVPPSTPTGQELRDREDGFPLEETAASLFESAAFAKPIAAEPTSLYAAPAVSIESEAVSRKGDAPPASAPPTTVAPREHRLRIFNVVLPVLTILLGALLVSLVFKFVWPAPHTSLGLRAIYMVGAAMAIAIAAIQLKFNTSLGGLLREAEEKHAEVVRSHTHLEERVTELTAANTLLNNWTLQFQAATQISQTVTSVLDPHELLQEAVNMIQDRLGVYYVGLFLIDDSGQRAELRADTRSRQAALKASARAGRPGENGHEMLEQGHQLEVGNASTVGWCIANSQARVALDIDEQASRSDQSLLPQTRSEMVMPLRLSGRAIGALDLQSTQHQAFSQEDVSVLQTMADQLAVAIDNAQAFAVLQARIEESEELRRSYQREWRPQFAMRPVATRYERTQPGITSSDVDALPEVDQAVARQEMVIESSTNSGKGKAALVTPITLRDEVIGALGFQEMNGRQWTSDEIALLEDIAGQVALAVENTRLFEQTQAALNETEALYRASHRITSSTDLPTLYQVLVDEMADRLGADQCQLAIFDPQKGYGELVADNRPSSDRRQTRVPMAGNPAYEILRDTQQPLVIQDASAHPAFAHFQDLLDQDNIKSMLFVPIVVRGELIGGLEIDCVGEKRVFTEAELDFCQTLARQAAIAIDNVRAFVQIQQRAHEMGMLFNISQSLASAPLQSEEIGTIICRQLAAVTGVPECSLSLLITSDGTMQVLVDYYQDEDDILLMEDKETFRLSDYPATARVMETLEPLVVHASDPNADPSELAYMQEHGVTTLTIIPMALKGQAIGVIKLDSWDKERHYTAEELNLVMTLANQAAVALENARLYEEQRHTAERLLEMDKLKTQFLANMSHELRTPLNSIIGFSRVILKGIDGPLTEMQQTDLTAIYNSGQHLLGLINDILDVSKIEAGKMELNFDEVDLKPIIKGVMSSAVGLVKDKPIQLAHHVPEDLPNIWADGTRVRQVLLNLISNATKFTERGRITLTASYDNDWVTLCVSDTGLGIPEDKVHSIFEEFTQVDGSSTRSAGGTGLGLPISRRFIEMHGGTITVKSKLGAGSSFAVTLPISAQSLSKTEPSQEQPELTPQTSDCRLVLVVDDDPGVISLYRRYLEGEGYQVIGVSSSDEALDQASKLQPFAVTLDVMMPTKDGWQVLQELKNCPQTQHIPIIICSIVSDEGLGFSLGAADYLVKPIMEDELLTALARLDQREDEVDVLVIDDQADDILLIRRILEAQPRYRVIEAHDGQTGIDLVHRRRPDLMILDLMMPGVDGFAVLEALKQEPDTRNIPVIVITARVLSEAERQRLTGQVETLLQKGLFTERELMEDLTKALDRIESRRLKRA